MRILIVNSHRNLVGGVEKYLQAILPRLLGRGHAIGLLYENRLDLRSESIDRDARGLTTWCLAELGLEAVLRGVRDWKPDVVYAHGLEDEEVERALLKIDPCILYAHNYYGTCATGRKCHAFPRMRPCERRLGPMCLVLHYPRRCGGLSPVTAWQMYRQQTHVNSRLGRYRAILVASNHMRRDFLRNGVSLDRLYLVPYPTTEIVPAALPPESNAQTGRLLFVGRLTDLKGGDYLMQAIPKVAERLGRPFTLTVAGDGPDRARLEEMALKFQIQVEFRGWVKSEQKLELMRRAELLIVPSLWPEPFGLVGVEAGCAGLPAVGYAVGGIPDWLIPGDSGELAPGDPPTVDGLAAAVVRALRDPGHYAKLRHGAWKQARRYMVETHLCQLESIFDATVGTPLAAASLT